MTNDLVEKFLLLEISGKKGDLEQYKKSMCEASILNIHKIVLACIWDDEEKGKEFFDKVQNICMILNIEPILSIGYEEALFDQAMIGEARKSTPQFSNLISLEEYKKLMKVSIDEKQVNKCLTKIAQNY